MPPSPSVSEARGLDPEPGELWFVVGEQPDGEPGERVVVARREKAWNEGVQDLAAALNDADVDDTGLNWRARMDVVARVLREFGGSG